MWKAITHDVWNTAWKLHGWALYRIYHMLIYEIMTPQLLNAHCFTAPGPFSLMTLSSWCSFPYKAFNVRRQPCGHVQQFVAKWSQELNYSKTNFPSNLNYKLKSLMKRTYFYKFATTSRNKLCRFHMTFFCHWQLFFYFWLKIFQEKNYAGKKYKALSDIFVQQE